MIDMFHKNWATWDSSSSWSHWKCSVLLLQNVLCIFCAQFTYLKNKYFFYIYIYLSIHLFINLCIHSPIIFDLSPAICFFHPFHHSTWPGGVKARSERPWLLRCLSMRQNDAGIFDGPWLTGVHPNPVQQRTYYSIMLQVQSSHEDTTWFSIKNKSVAIWTKGCMKGMSCFQGPLWS